MTGLAPVAGVAGILLTGGASRRMGTDKATLVIEGETCARRVGRLLAQVASVALEVGPGHSGLPVVAEPRPGNGPLVALAAAADELGRMGHHGPALVLACDLPMLSEGLLRLLATWPGDGTVVPVVAGQGQSLCARLSSTALADAPAAARGRASMAALLERHPVTWLGEEAWGDVATQATFADLDTPDDLVRLGLAVPGRPSRSQLGGGSPRSGVTPVRVTALRGERHLELGDQVVTEEPMEIRVAGPGQPGLSVTTTMRTPGHDFELAAGFLLSEGIITTADELRGVDYCDDLKDPAQRFNVVTTRLARAVDQSAIRRNFSITASCGICGTATLEQLMVRCPPLAAQEDASVPASVLLGLPDSLREGQRLFSRTGGLHAAGLFARDGSLLSVREDVGRHNALDKLVGQALLAGGLPLSERVLALSGRVSFELVQKAAVAGIPVMVAVSAPSSLAVSTAERLGITLMGFVRGDRANVYTHPARVALDC